MSSLRRFTKIDLKNKHITFLYIMVLTDRMSPIDKKIKAPVYRNHSFVEKNIILMALIEMTLNSGTSSMVTGFKSILYVI